MLHFFRIFHLMFGVGLRLLFHMYCDNVVAVFLFSVLKLCVWLLYLDLKSGSVHPMYSAVLLLCCTVAW